MLKRVSLFLLTNLAIMAVITLVFGVLSMLGVRFGAGLGGMLASCAVMGFVGSFISLALSKWMAIRSTGARVIQSPQNGQEAWLKNTVEELAQKAGIGMPDVAIYDAPDANAFATGMRRDSSLVAVSTGLFRQMNQDQIKAVLAHEISHIQNGDMVTLTLIQGVVNTFVMFLARIAGGIVDKTVFGNRDGNGIGYFISVFVFQMIFGVLASIIVMWFSRQREFRADAGSANLYSTMSMISALEALKGPHVELPKEIKAFGIAGGGKMLSLLSSHPPLEDRIKALQHK